MKYSNLLKFMDGIRGDGQALQAVLLAAQIGGVGSEKRSRLACSGRRVVMLGERGGERRWKAGSSCGNTSGFGMDKRDGQT